jgi:hypothetical protein
MSSEPYDYRVQIDFMSDPETTAVKCGDCGWEGMASQLDGIVSCSLTPGHPSPAGRCPECESLAYVMEASCAT